MGDEKERYLVINTIAVSVAERVPFGIVPGVLSYGYGPEDAVLEAVTGGFHSALVFVEAAGGDTDDYPFDETRPTAEFFVFNLSNPSVPRTTVRVGSLVDPYSSLVAKEQRVSA